MGQMGENHCLLHPHLLRGQCLILRYHSTAWSHTWLHHYHIPLLICKLNFCLLVDLFVGSMIGSLTQLCVGGFNVSCKSCCCCWWWSGG
jgi:hypothetical protein